MIVGKDWIGRIDWAASVQKRYLPLTLITILQLGFSISIGLHSMTARDAIWHQQMKKRSQRCVSVCSIYSIVLSNLVWDL